MTAEITGEHPAYRFDENLDSPAPHLRLVGGTGGILTRARVRTLETIMSRNPWLSDLLRATRNEGRAEGYREGVTAALNNLTSGEHAKAHPDIPLNFIEALQRGPNLHAPLGDTTVDIDGLSVTVALCDQGAWTPLSDSVGAWKALRESVRTAHASPYAAHVLSPTLPPEIATATWQDGCGRVTTITNALIRAEDYPREASTRSGPQQA